MPRRVASSERSARMPAAASMIASRPWTTCAGEALSMDCEGTRCGSRPAHLAVRARLPDAGARTPAVADAAAAVGDGADVDGSAVRALDRGPGRGARGG